MRRKILGVFVDDIPKEEALKIVSSWKTGSHLVFTPGPEFLVTAGEDPEFKKVLNSADLNLPDGFGLKLLAGVKNITPGVDFMRALCVLSLSKGWSIGLVGGAAGVAAATARVLEQKYPGLKIAFAREEASDVLPYSDILFVALGHSKQEKLLYQMRSPRFARDLKFRVGMGVGGSFDFISGKVPEPPAVLNRFGLKWLGRFVSRPRYMLPKLWKALFVFPLKYLLDIYSK